MMKEFKEFIAQGNVMDAAIGFVLGLAFKAIVDSVVNDILMPIVGYLTAGIDFAHLKIVLKQVVPDVSEEVAITYGQLIQSIITFLIVAFFLFLVVRTLNKLRRKKEEEAKEAVEEPAESELDLLKDIRELLSSDEKTKE
ncbi:MAG: large-conductance mechanosensitive channel protein MscL [Clostridiales bacterium]|jgi:large conductance mechanosensitive channel|nr:large-conductance mechanosensitive channel protein MscL [Clostridiales bacterium]MDD3418618.1 large-conductance mechanosensitive channel protein MscL [Eubacteriales bacterium]MDD4186145.1 large-conductance mechanosensitive channel protein MscL [Eubacteriales bacterium]NLG30840.1 large-conductance mechanosensitive channel protein MscL [Clostridiaceae bacterium]